MSSKWEKHIKQKQAFFAAADETSDYVEHSGVKGMKWGVRRYQDYDGTRLEKGEKVYKDHSDDYAKAMNNMHEGRSKMSNADLKSTTQRMTDEVNYERARRQYMETFYPQKVSLGQRIVKEGGQVLGNSLKSVATKAFVSIGNGLCEAALKKMSEKSGLNLASSYPQSKQEKKDEDKKDGGNN